MSKSLRPTIVVFDYGVGNLHSIKKALELGGARVVVTNNVKTVIKAKAIVFPGVGDFGAVMRNIGPMREQLVRKLEEGVPALGICIGFQIMFDGSQEAKAKGLGFLKGQVLKFKKVRVPHMGWNDVHITSAGRGDMLLKGIRDGRHFYYANSYAPSPSGKGPKVLGTTTYGRKFTTIMRKCNTYGTQFHPEKSGRDGLRLVRNFVRFVSKEAYK